MKIINISNLIFSIGLTFNTVKAGVITTFGYENLDNVLNNLTVDSNSPFTLPYSVKYTVETINNADFQYNIFCLDDYEDMCNTLKGELSYALETLSSTFEFFQPVVFDAFIGSNINYGFNEQAIAVTMDVNFVPLKSSNDTNAPVYIYPQALTKQLQIESDVNYKKNDFIIFISNRKHIDYSYNNVSYSQVILHEIIHGLGMISGVNVAMLLENQLNEDDNIVKLVPTAITNFDSEKLEKVKTGAELANIKDTAKIAGFYPMTVFEKHIVSLKNKNDKIFTPLSHLYKELNCFEGGEILMKDVTEDDILECLIQLSPETNKLINNIPVDYLLSRRTIGFLTETDKVVPLQTFENQFIQGVSICHTDFKGLEELMDTIIKNSTLTTLEEKNTFINEDNFEEFMDEEFLMYYAVSNVSKESFLETVGKNNKHGLIGPGVTDILKTIGWTEKGESRSQQKYYVDNSLEMPNQSTFKFLQKYFEINRTPISNYDDTFSIQSTTEMSGARHSFEISWTTLFSLFMIISTYIINTIF